ncbi:MAG TPA: ABC transporter permease [Candidatus Bathyarchaeia archaeon]|nr:ABC transporter permease [Candidatus Bathyarchaeia archaeon]
MKFAPLVLKHLRKNWLRTLSTVLAMAVCIFLFCTLHTVVEAVEFGLHSGNASRLVTRHYVSLVYNLPLTYKQRVAAVPGVKETVIEAWFGGIYRDPKNFFANFAVEPGPFLDIFPEVMLPPEQKARWLEDERGAIVGRKLAQRFDFKVGQLIQMESTIPPYRTGHPFEFVIDGIYDTDERKYPGTDLNSLYFNYKYLYEATKSPPMGPIGIGWLTERIDEPQNAGKISKAIDAEFENSDTPTKTETEQAFFAGFVAMAGNLALLLNGIGLAVSFTILLVTANTMSIAVRERRQEIAVLKTLGFSSVLVMTLIISEALLIGAAGGLLGLVLSKGLLNILPDVPVLGDIVATYPNFGLSPQTAGLGMGIALLLGLAAGFFPAMTGYRSRIAEALRQI